MPDIHFSFIIPAKNEERSLALCIKSILSQNYGTGLVDIIVIDDYSSDNTAEIAKSLGAMVLTPNLPRRKTSRAQNKNFALPFSNGDYLLFIDAHIQLPSTDWLRNVSTYVQQNSENSATLLASFPAIPPPELTPLLNIFPAEDVKAVTLSVINNRGSNQFVGGSMLISKNFFLKLGGFPPIPSSEDISLYNKAIECGASYAFLSELWVWHLDDKLRSTKNWLKRNLKEGFYSTAYGKEHIDSDKFGKTYSALLGLSIVGVFFFPYIFGALLFLLLSVNLSLHSYRALLAMKLSKGKMSILHLLALITIESIQALVLRLSVCAGMFFRMFRSVRRSQKCSET